MSLYEVPEAHTPYPAVMCVNWMKITLPLLYDSLKANFTSYFIHFCVSCQVWDTDIAAIEHLPLNVPCRSIHSNQCLKLALAQSTRDARFWAVASWNCDLVVHLAPWNLVIHKLFTYFAGQHSTVNQSRYEVIYWANLFCIFPLPWRVLLMRNSCLETWAGQLYFSC